MSNITDQTLSEIIRNINKKYLNTSQPDNAFSISIPLLGSIAAGNPIEAIENPNEFVSIPSNFVTKNNQYFVKK